MQRLKIILLLCLLSLGIILLNGCEQISNNETALNSTEIKQFNDNFLNIKANFKQEDFIEVTDDWDIRNLVPELKGESRDMHSQFRETNKTLVYKNSKNGVVVMVGISLNHLKNPEWRNALHYSPNFYNAKEEENGITKNYSDIFPNTSLSIYNFTSKGMNISIASISDRSKVPNSDDIHSDFFASLTKFINDQI
ncbi:MULTISPECIES: hypothetical protein [Brevibacillus]|uniref:hypothetical protein n=1 Tax=Brevibacillus TaxID=55080 RepID=UPI000E2F7497|nr:MULTISPECIES: hypothetical protein [Brevibacillus]MBG9787878.1 hypothetical protein [Brevibacillus laterosporus]RFB35845.1 hypothetical protein DZB91_06000 [Brevibacillus sp. VP]